MVVIDTATDAVSGEIVLHGGNPFGDASGIVREPGTGKLVIASAGDILRRRRRRPRAHRPGDAHRGGAFFVDETTLGGNVLDFVLLSPTKGYAVRAGRGAREPPRRLRPERRRRRRATLYAREAFFPDVALGARRRSCGWPTRACPIPGIRLFDPATDQPVAGAGRSRVGLPPFSIGFVP